MEAFDGGRDCQQGSVEVLYDELESELRKLTANSQKAVLKLLEESTVEADLLRLTEESNREWLALHVLKRENEKYEQKIAGCD